VLLAWVAAGVALAAPTGAAAFYGNAADGVPGALLVSADYARLEQGDDTTAFAAVSANGRYVAIETHARNFFADNDPDPPGQFRAGGVFRFDLQGKGLEKVADGDLYEEGEEATFLRRGASNPSISGDGRYVAFATGEQLVADDDNDHVDVYVRDMAFPIGDAGAFDLVSARDGGDVPASYGAPEFPFVGSQPGAEVSRGVAISADGQRVAFRTEAPTDLPARAGVDVPAGQVFLRDRAADTTTLVTAVRDFEAGEMTDLPAGGAFGAALSGDGTTVAWTGANAEAQTDFLSGEIFNPASRYYLWRRLVGDPTQAPTRRITGLADPEDPACTVSPPSFNRTATGPCYGPLADPEGGPANISSQLPALSADGYAAAFLTGSGPRPVEATSPGLDLFFTRMDPGLTRKQATVELTRDTIGDPATSPPIGSIAISPDGRYLAIATVRTQFALPALQLLGEPRQVPGPRELYVADLQTRTLERVTRSFTGGDIASDVQNGITVSTGGQQVAFVSFAGNLFLGDANQRADAFVATLQPDLEGGPPVSDVNADGAAGSIEFDREGPRIGVRAKSKPDGSILVTVSVPAAGGVKAVARGQAGRPRKLRSLSTGSARARGEGRSEVRMTLRPVERYRNELLARERIPTRVSVEYVASRGGRRVGASLRSAFRQTTPLPIRSAKPRR
jgi:WD40-like Beta Propeller Repeat